MLRRNAADNNVYNIRHVSDAVVYLDKGKYLWRFNLVKLIYHESMRSAPQQCSR